MCYNALSNQEGGMAYQIVEGKGFTWWHFSQLEDADFEILKDKFLFHPLDFDDLREDTELTKLDTYKHYLFTVFNIPIFEGGKEKVGKQNLAVFIGKDYVVTVTKYGLESVNRFFARAQRSSGLRRNALGKTTGYFLYKLLDYVYRDVNIVLRQIVRETEEVEKRVYGEHTKGTTKRLGILRRNVLFLRHIIDPHKYVIDQLKGAGRTYIPKTTGIYFDDLNDLLNSISVNLDNIVHIVDGLFDVNETFLSHRTNDIIRLLTLVSIVFIPPTLVTSFYGMNVPGLPFAQHPAKVAAVVATAFLIAGIWVIYVDKRK